MRFNRTSNRQSQITLEDVGSSNPAESQVEFKLANTLPSKLLSRDHILALALHMKKKYSMTVASHLYIFFPSTFPSSERVFA